MDNENDIESTSPASAIHASPPLLPLEMISRQMKREAMTAISVKPKARVVAYLRRSKKIENDSIERQTDRAKEYAQALGYEVEVFYIDKGKTGETWNRKAFRQMMEDAQEGLFTILLVEEVDRLGRTLSIISTVCEKLAAFGVEIHSITTKAPVQPVEIAFKGFMAAEHQVLLRRRTTDGLWRAVRNGVIPHIAWGYRAGSGTGHREIDENLRSHIEWMFGARLDGMSFAAIAAVLNEREVPKKIVKTPWMAHDVRAVLINPIYAGIFVFGKSSKRRDPATDTIVVERRPPSEWEVQAFPHMQIVSRETFDACYATLSKQALRVARGKSLLSGKAICTHCARSMVYHQNDHGTHYRGFFCHPETAKDHGQALDLIWLNDWVFDVIASLLSDNEQAARFDEEVQEHYKFTVSDDEERRAELVKRLSRLGDALARLLDEELSSFYPADFIATRKQRLGDEYQAAQAELERLPKRALKLRQIEPERRQNLLQTLDRVRALANQHGQEKDVPTPEEKQALEIIRNMVKTIEMTEIEYTRSSTVKLTISLPHVYGYRFRGADGSFGDLVFERKYYRDTRRKVPQMVEAFRNRMFFTTDDEFEAVMAKHGEALQKTFAEADIRAILDNTIFLATTGLTFHLLVDARPYAEHKQMHCWVLKLVRHGHWQDICELFRTDMPNRYERFHPLHIGYACLMRLGYSGRNNSPKVGAFGQAA